MEISLKKVVHSARSAYLSVDSSGLLALVLSVALAIPVLVLLFSLFGEPGEAWGSIVANIWSGYLWTTLLLVLGVAGLAFLMGVPAAWFVTTCQFPGRRLLEWALVLPLALPTYIAAYAWAGLMDFTSPVQTFLRSLGLGFTIDIMDLNGVIWVMAFVLYPYVYVSARIAFMQQAQNQIDSARMLGASALRTFFKVALPAARPAIAGGMFLVLMEVLNDYGAVKYYGVNTLTTGIFRSWFAFGDTVTAVRLSSMLVVMLLILLGIERYQRRNASFANAGYVSLSAHRFIPGVWGRIGVISICLFPVMAGFVLPCIQMMTWAWHSTDIFMRSTFLQWFVNSVFLAAVVSLFCALLSFLLVVAVRRTRQRGVGAISLLATMGYAIPGAVIAIGVLIPSLMIDRWLISLSALVGKNTGLILTGGMIALCYGCIVRYLAVAYYPIEAGYRKVGKHIGDVTRVLPHKRWKTLYEVDLKLVKSAVAGGGLLVFVDVMKELPLTLILRPFNVNTLSTKAFELATDERLAEAAWPALVLVATGLIPVLLLTRVMSKSSYRADADHS